MGRLRIGRSALTLMALAAALCCGAQAAPVKSLMEMRTEKVIVQKWDLSCGAAVIATLLTHDLEDPVSEREAAIAMMGREEYIANPVIVRVREGFSLLDMKRFVESRGFRGAGYGQMTMADLLAKAPVIVPINRNGYNHFVIVRGQMGNRLLLADPSFGTRTMRVDQFENIWKPHPKLGRVGFAVSRAEEGAPQDFGLAPTPDEFWTLS